MKNLIKPMIVFGMILFLLGAMASCKEKNEEKEIEELVEKLGDAKTEKEVAEITEKIAKLQERKEKKEIKEIEAELGKLFTFWQFGGLSMNEKITQFSMTFEVISVHKQHPFVPEVARTPKGKKHVKLIAKIRNLGPREGTPSATMELKVDKGYIYNVGPFGDMYPGPRYEPAISGKTMYSLEPGQTGWKLFHSEIPEDTTPVEIFGTLGGATFPRIPGKLKFRLKIPRYYFGSRQDIDRSKQEEATGTSKKETIRTEKISKESIVGKYIIEVVRKDGTTVKSPGVMIFKRDGRLVVSSSGSEFVIPDQKWEFKDGVVQIYQYGIDGPSEPLIGELKGLTIIFRTKDGELRYIKQASQDGQVSVGEKKEKTDMFADDMIWVKCNNPDCKTEYQTSKKGYFKYVEEHMDPMAPTAPSLVCEKCGEQSVFRAEKCMNPDCGLVFFRGTIPNDFPDRCPDCKRSETEEIRKRRKSGGYSQREQETKSRTVYDVWKEDEERLEAEPSETQFKKLSPEEEIQAQRLFEAAMTERKMGRLPGIRLGYKNMVYHCREIIRRWPDSEYAFKAKRMLADIPERYHKMYNITKEEMDFSNFYQTPATNKQELVDALEGLRHAMIKKINLEVDVTAQCFTSVKEYRRAKLLADVLRPVLRVLQGTLSVLSKISDATTLSGQVKTSLDNAQYVSEATSLFFMVNGLRESGEKLYYAIDDTAGYVRTVKDMLQAADQTTVVRMDPRAYKQVIKQYLDSEQGTPLIIVRTSELAPDKKPAKGALVLYKIIREEFRTLIEQIQRSELPQDFPLKDVVAEIEQLKHQIVEAGVHNIDVHYSIYHQGRKVHQSRKLGAVAEHNKAFAQVAGALAKRLDIEIYAECAQLAATGADAAYIVTYKVPGAGEAVKMTQQVSLLPQIVIEGKKMFTVDPEDQFYQMPQEMLFSLAIEFSSLLRIADDTVLSLTKLLEETSSQVPPSEVQPTPTSTKQKETAKQIEKQVEETVKSLFKKLLRKKR